MYVPQELQATLGRLTVTKVKKKKSGTAHMSIVPATWEAETGRSQV